MYYLLQWPMLFAVNIAVEQEVIVTTINIARFTFTRYR